VRVGDVDSGQVDVSALKEAREIVCCRTLPEIHGMVRH
jgi:hypothetical protein